VGIVLKDLREFILFAILAGVHHATGLQDEVG